MNALASVPGLVEFNDPRIQRWNFAPYVGVAVSPWTNRTVIRAGAGMWYDANYWQPFTMGFAPQIARVTTGNLGSNAPGFLAGGGLADPAGNNTGDLTAAQARRGVGNFIGNQEMPYSLQWNVALQQAFWENTSIEFKIVGNRGVHQPVFGRLNYAGVTEQRSLPLFTDSPAQSQLNGLPLTLGMLQTPLANEFTAAGFTNPINTINFEGNSWYHGATAALNHRFTGGFQANASYTWSRWEDDSTGTPLDLGMPMRMRTWSMFNRRHQANVTGMFEVAPLFQNSWGVARNVFADFNISATYNFQTGNQLTPVAGINSGLNNNAFGTGVIVNSNATGADFTRVTPLTNAGNQTVAYRIADPNARFIVPAPGVFSGFNRGGLMLPDLHNVNVAAVKRFNFRERASFELRGEAYNVLNRRNATGSSVHSMGSGLMPNLGMIPGTVDVNNLANLDLLPSNSRMLQVALRLTF